jgi:ATP-dependent helicase/nuclease subunit B
VSLRFILGRAGSGKSTQCLEEIQKEVLTDPFGAPLILLVPEQATHMMEMSLAHSPELGGILRAQVLSFRRLAWRIFSETGGGQKVLIGEVGKRMLLRRLLLKHRSQLRIFARSATRPGMADLLAQAIAEFKTYRITPNDLRQVQDIDELLVQKLNELALLYEEFNHSLGQDVRDPNDELTIVAEKIPYAPYLHGAKIWVDGFKGFTPQELYILQSLIGIAEQVTLTLPLDPKIVERAYRFTDSSEHKNPHSKSRLLKPGDEIFSGPWQTYQLLQRIALNLGIYVEKSTFLPASRRFLNPELQHLEKFYNSYPTQSYNPESTSSNISSEPGLQLFTAVNRRAEVEGVARELRRLAREEGKQWNNLAVITRELEGYQEIIEQVFPTYEIPFFLDSKRSVLHHPLLELILSALETARTNWGYEPLFRCLKTDFFPLGKDILDRLENYCIAHGIRGNAWNNGEDWNFRNKWSSGDQELRRLEEKQQNAVINQARRVVYERFEPFMKVLTSSSLNVRQTTEAIYNLLIQLEVPERLQNWAEEALKEGNLAEARLQNQIWNAVVEVLDEMVAGLGDECLNLADYALILSSGLENLKLGLIPPGMDQVLIGSLERSQNPEVAVLFLLGANDGILPAKPSTDGVFDSIERERLENSGLTLAPKGKAQLFDEQFFIYTALTRATEKLFVSYPLTDEEGKGLSASPVVTRLKMIFPNLSETYLVNLEEDLRWVSHPHALLPAYALQLSQLRQGKTLSPLWMAIQNWLQLNAANLPQIRLIEEGVKAENREERLPKHLTRRLYGKRLLTSVSRLEKFARCPFAHYSQYGLKLKDRSTFQLSSPDMGQFFHAVLHEFALTVQERQLNWGELTKEDSWNIVSELSEKIAPNLQNEILLSSARYRYLKHKLNRTVHHAVRVLGEHARQGIFVPIQLEVKFGPDEVLPGIQVPLTDGNSLTLRGQIDRIDGALLEKQMYLRILDYKSREPRITLNHFYYGLDIQLLAYLDAALQGAEILLEPLSSLLDLNQATPTNDSSTESPHGIAVDPPPIHPAGFLYFPVLEPQLEFKSRLTTEQMEYERIKAVKVKGYLLANRNVLEAMDRSLTSGDSHLLGLKIKKDGDFKKGAPILTENQFHLLRKHLHYFLQETGEDILNGNISISPYRQGKDHACQYCSYKPVCHFDPYLPENSYRTLPVLKDSDIWNQFASLPADDLIITSNSEKREAFTKTNALKPVNSIRQHNPEMEYFWLGEEKGKASEKEGEPNE